MGGFAEFVCTVIEAAFWLAPLVGLGGLRRAALSFCVSKSFRRYQRSCASAPSSSS